MSDPERPAATPTPLSIDRDSLAALLADEESTERLCREACAVTRTVHGPRIHLRGVVEFDNYCRNRCRYCGINAQAKGLRRYRLEPDAIVAAAREAVAFGCRTVVLQSGEDPALDVEAMADVVRRIKTELGVAVTLGCGELPKEVYACWKDAGADRYLLKIETTDPDLYAALHPGMSLAARYRCQEDLFDLGYQVGTGNLAGLPGQTTTHLAADLLSFAARPYDMLALGPLVPAPGTDLAEAVSPAPGLMRRLVACMRLLAPGAHLPATSALCSLDPALRGGMFDAGANVWMPSFTPAAASGDYALYRRAACRTRDDCAACLREILDRRGLAIADDQGHGLRRHGV